MDKRAKIALIVTLAVLVIAGLFVLAKSGKLQAGLLSNLLKKPAVAHPAAAAGAVPVASPSPYPAGPAPSWYTPPNGYNFGQPKAGSSYNNAAQNAAYITAAGGFLSGILGMFDFGGGDDTDVAGAAAATSNDLGGLSASGTLPENDYSGAGWNPNPDLSGLYGAGPDPTGNGYGAGDLWSGLDSMGGDYSGAGGLGDLFGGLGASGGDTGAADQLRDLF